MLKVFCLRIRISEERSEIFVKYSFKATFLYALGWCIICAVILHLNAHHDHTFSPTIIFVIFISYELLSNVSVDFPTYRYIKKHRPDIFKGAFVKLPSIDHFKFIAYVFSGVTNEDDKDEVLLKRYGRANVIIRSGIMLSVFILIGVM